MEWSKSRSGAEKMELSKSRNRGKLGRGEENWEIIRPRSGALIGILFFILVRVPQITKIVQIKNNKILVEI